MNVNGDDAAAAIASELVAAELLFVSDVEGVRGENGDTLRHIDIEQAGALVLTGVAESGMAAKLEAAIRALEKGVGRVRIGDIASIADPDRGTVLTQLARVAG